jgi:hypothetical protein
MVRPPRGGDLQVFRISGLELVNQTFASWNQIGGWLRRLEALRQALIMRF